MMNYIAFKKIISLELQRGVYEEEVCKDIL